MLKIACIDNLSARAFRLVRPPFPARLSFGPPSDTFRWMASGQVDAALAPAARLDALANISESIGAYGIACRGAVSSVRLFALERLATLAQRAEPVHASPKSQTSRALLACLFHLDYGTAPIWAESSKDARAWLRIGEDALLPTPEEPAWTGVHDLGQWWHERTGCSFVYARWIVRKDLDGPRKQEIEQWLEENVSAANSSTGMEQMISDVQAHSAPGLSQRFLLDYYGRIRPRLTLPDLQGLEQFLALIREHAAWTQTA